MTEQRVSDQNVAEVNLLASPLAMKARVPLSTRAEQTVANARTAIQDILDGKDHRLLLIAGPCSIHDLSAAEEYASKLKILADDVDDTMLVLMRVYFSKPRTTGGWKGFVNDPRLDGSFRIEEGLQEARRFLTSLGEMGVPVGTEALDSIVPQYIDDLISWNAIGARTAESQTHRELASGLSTPVGFKNGTDGNISIAVNALKAMRMSHHFLGISQDGQCAVIKTQGNPYGHVILRGGIKPNYDRDSIAQCEQLLVDAKLPANIVVDCSHGNSEKDHTKQATVLRACVQQIVDGNRSIMGLMVESNLHEGNQVIPAVKNELKYGVSITDACMGWETTEALIHEASETILAKMKHRER